MISAAVVSSRCAPRTLAACWAAASPRPARICGITATPVSNPDRPRASLGKTISEMPTIIHGSPFWRNTAPHQSVTVDASWPTCTSAVAMTTTLSAR